MPPCSCPDGQFSSGLFLTPINKPPALACRGSRSVKIAARGWLLRSGRGGVRPLLTDAWARPVAGIIRRDLQWRPAKSVRHGCDMMGRFSQRVAYLIELLEADYHGRGR